MLVHFQKENKGVSAIHFCRRTLSDWSTLNIGLGALNIRGMRIARGLNRGNPTISFIADAKKE